MGENSLALEQLWCKLKKNEEQYYQSAAKYCLLVEGLRSPTSKSIKIRAAILSKDFRQKNPLLTTPITFRAKKLETEQAWDTLCSHEREYYYSLAEYRMLDEGINNPTSVQIKKEINRLSHIYLKKTILLGNPLSITELKCLELASFGKGVTESAIILDLSESSIKTLHSSACQKLSSVNLLEAIFYAAWIGYLPIKAKLVSQRFVETEEAENTSI